MNKFVWIFMIIILSACGSELDFDPMSEWVGNYRITWIEGSYVWNWLDSKIASDGQDRITGVSVSEPSWNIIFQSDGTWYSAISSGVYIGLQTYSEFSILFEGTYEAFADTYELRLDNVTTNVGKLDVSEIIDFVKSQRTGTWTYWTHKYSNSLRRFGRFEVM